MKMFSPYMMINKGNIWVGLWWRTEQNNYRLVQGTFLR